MASLDRCYTRPRNMSNAELHKLRKRLDLNCVEEPDVSARDTPNAKRARRNGSARSVHVSWRVMQSKQLRADRLLIYLPICSQSAFKRAGKKTGEYKVVNSSTAQCLNAKTESL